MENIEASGGIGTAIQGQYVCWQMNLSFQNMIFNSESYVIQNYV